MLGVHNLYTLIKNTIVKNVFRNTLYRYICYLQKAFITICLLSDTPFTFGFGENDVRLRFSLCEGLNPFRGSLDINL